MHTSFYWDLRLTLCYLGWNRDEISMELRLTNLNTELVLYSDPHCKYNPKLTNSLKKAECSKCLPPLTIGSSYSNCLSSISGSPLTRTANAVSVQGLGEVASGDDDSEEDITI